MKLKQISVPIENSRDRMYKLTQALGEKGIKPIAITLVDTENNGELRVLVSETATARQILMQKAIPARIDDVVAVQLEDKPEQLPDLLLRLMQADIKVKYGYALAGQNSKETVMIFCFSDNDKAIEVLSNKEILPLDSKTFGKLEAAC